jgi:hypothetical protein
MGNGRHFARRGQFLQYRPELNGEAGVEKCWKGVEVQGIDMRLEYRIAENDDKRISCEKALGERQIV